jgi:hypothetical protein
MNEAEIDTALVAAASDHWQKVAKVIARAVDKLDGAQVDAKDLWRAVGARVVGLVDSGKLEATGFVEFWRLSEVRLRARSVETPGYPHAPPSMPESEGLNRAMFRRGSFAAEDAWRTFVRHGEQPTSDQEEAILVCDGLRRHLEVDGFVLWMQFTPEAKIGDEMEFVRDGWDYEMCDCCGAHIQAGSTCWVADGDPAQVFCECCYEQLPPE